MFAERGYDSVSMRDLARELSVQAPSIYSHFPSKAELLRSIVMPALAVLSDLMDRAPANPDAPAVRDWLTAYEGWLVDHRDAARMALLDLGAGADPVVGPAVLQIRQRGTKLMRGFGALNDAAARAAIGALVYPAILHRVSREELPEVVDAALRALNG